MIGLVIVTHGRLAEEFVFAMEHVVGPQAAVEAICIGPEDDMERRRKDILAACERVDTGAGVDAGLADIALAAGQACRRDWKRVELHIVRAKAANVADDALAEALTVCILPSGNPGFVQACGIWRALILDGKVQASPAFRMAVEAI